MLTLGDGNCAFNAFALGLRDLVLRGILTDIPDSFLLQARDFKSNWKNSADFINWIKNLEDTNILQITLAPILRQLSNNYLKKNFQHSNLDATFETAMYD